MGHEFAACGRRIAAIAAVMMLAATLGWLIPGAHVRAAAVVSNCHNSGAGSLRDAVYNAVSGDTITFSVDCPSGSGTQITLAAPLAITTDLTINGIGHAIAVSGNDAVTVFAIDAGLNVNLNRLTITHGKGTSGGGIAYGTSSDTPGNSRLDVSTSTFDSNQATTPDGGGGIFSSGGALSVSDSTFTNNTAPSGGGIASQGVLSVRRSSFSNNQGTGAGIITTSGSVENSTFSGNRGEGIVLGGMRTTVTVTASTFTDNAGPGISIIGRDTGVTVTNSTFSGNDASGNNDGIANNDSGIGSMAVLNSTVHPNHISSLPSYQIINTIADRANGTHGGDHNLIGQTPDPRLGTLGDYGGATQTYPLLPGSPAIDAGDQTTCDGITTDQRGAPRTLNGQCDIGAFEARFTLTATSSANQIAPPGSSFPHSLTVTLSTPDTGVPLDGGAITFTTPTSGASASISPNPAMTNASGHATANATANGTTGTYTVTASTPGAAAVTFTLTNATIQLVVNATTDGVATITNCAAGNARTCRLRDAIAAIGAGAGSPSPTITFAASIFPPNGSKTITLQPAQGPIVLTNNVTINGPGATALALDGGSGTIVLGVNPNVTATVQDLTIQHGNGSTTSAGGIVNFGTLTVTGVALVANTGSGGAILNNGTLALTRSTVSGNSAGIQNAATAAGQQVAASVANSTVANNTGSGITNTASATGAQATLALTNVTVAGNGAGGVVITANGGIPTVTALNTIISGNTGSDITGPFTGGANVIGLNALLGPLANNGGTTETMALQPGSPAIAHGAPSVCAAAPIGNVDERGITRPSGTCAIGAYEPPTVTAIAPSSGGTGGGETVNVSGAAFLAGATVRLGGTACTNAQVISETKLTCVAPAHAAGAVDVMVKSGGGTATLAGGYTYGVVNALPQQQPGNQGSQTSNSPSPLPRPAPTNQGSQGGSPASLPSRRP